MQPIPLFGLGAVPLVAAPDKVIRLFDNACPNRVVVDVAKHLEKIAVTVNQHRLKTAPEEPDRLFYGYDYNAGCKPR